jgi:hypothetical protein
MKILRLTVLDCAEPAKWDIISRPIEGYRGLSRAFRKPRQTNFIFNIALIFLLMLLTNFGK